MATVFISKKKTSAVIQRFGFSKSSRRRLSVNQRKTERFNNFIKIKNFKSIRSGENRKLWFTAEKHIKSADKNRRAKVVVNTVRLYSVSRENISSLFVGVSLRDAHARRASRGYSRRGGRHNRRKINNIIILL